MPFSSDRRLQHKAKDLTHTLLALLDGSVVIAITYLTAIWVSNGVFTAPYAVLLVVMLIAMAFFYDRFRVYHLHSSFLRHALALLEAWAATFALLLLIAFATKQTETYSRLALAAIFVGGLLAQGVLHAAVRIFKGRFKARATTSKALIIGTGEIANQIFYRVHQNPWIPQSIVGAVSGPQQDSHPAELATGLNSLGELDDVLPLIARHQIQTVYIAVPLETSPDIERLYFQLLDRNVNIHWVPNIFSLPLINHSMREINGLPILTLSETPLTGTSRIIKELEDRVLAALILVLASPIMIVTAIAIRLDSPGGVFFRQPRTGWDGKDFRIWKFRSMRTDQVIDSQHLKQATRDDPRVTRVGRFIRRTSIDELPQLFNVLIGDMSLVGPRPHAVQHNNEYARKISTYMARHRIKPGITGLAQVRGYRGETTDLSLMIKRVESDIEYINNWSIWLDLLIIARTAFSLFGRNAY